MEFRRGVSLIELISGFAIAGLIGMLIATLYFTHFKVFTNQNTSIDVASQNKIAINEMENQIKEGESIVDTCSNCSGDTTSATVLVIRLWPLDTNGEPLDPGGTAYDYIVYKRDPTDNTKLIKKIVADPASSRTSSQKILATEISNLQFAYDNPTPSLALEVTVTLTTTKTATVSKKDQTTTQMVKVLLRNK